MEFGVLTTGLPDGIVRIQGANMGFGSRFSLKKNSWRPMGLSNYL